MTADLVRIVAEVAQAIADAHQAGLLARQLRERLVGGGAETMTLLEACVDLRADAELARFEQDAVLADVAETRAQIFSELGLQVMHAGGWPVAVAGATDDAVSRWAATVALIGEGLSDDKLARHDRAGAPKVEAVFDLDAKVATVRIDLSALIEDWRAGAVEAPGRHDHGWPTVTGQIYGDPRCDDGQSITLYGLPAPDGKTMRGLHMTYGLGRPAEVVS